MNALFGDSLANSKTDRTVVRSVTLTATIGTNAELKLYDYANDAVDPRLVVHANSGETVNVHFGGLEFPNGITIVPDADTQNYIVEYDA